MNKRAKFLYQAIIQIILVGLVFTLLFAASMNRVNSRDVKQQVLEKQIALLIDSAPEGTTLVVAKKNKNGEITNLEIRNGRVFVYVDRQSYSKGYAFFSKFNVELKEDDENYYINIGKNENSK